MKRLIIFCALLIILVVASTILLQNRPDSEEKVTANLHREFFTCLPEHLSEAQRKEIAGILDRFSQMAQDGKVEAADQIEVRADLDRYTQAGRITEEELQLFMAKVSYLTYKSNPKANLPEGRIDHPLLNPDDS